MKNKEPISYWESEIALALKSIAKYDHSVSVPSFGSVFCQDGKFINQAQDYIASIYGAEFAYPGTNGTTSLNALALMTCAYPGDEVLIQRDSHVSVFSSIIHLGLKPIYIMPYFDKNLGITYGVTAEQIEQLLIKHPNIKVVFLTYPNYFGVGTNIDECVEVVHKYGKKIIVDSAHGSLSNFHPEMPKTAVKANADIVTYSIHKTCSALGQGSLLLINDVNLIDRFYQNVNASGFVSTSFSTIILMSIFWAIENLSLYGEKMIAEKIKLSNWARNEINKLNYVKSFSFKSQTDGFASFDPLRLTIDVSRLGMTGYQVGEILIKKFKNYPEMETINNVLFLIQLGTHKEDIENLINILKNISPNKSPQFINQIGYPKIPQQALLPREVFYSQNRMRINVEDSVGLISAETISTYPPGSAVIVAGEVITREIINYLKTNIKIGGTLKGASDNLFNSIEIIKE